VALGRTHPDHYPRAANSDRRIGLAKVTGDAEGKLHDLFVLCYQEFTGTVLRRDGHDVSAVSGPK
jgi:hypothetical protein